MLWPFLQEGKSEIPSGSRRISQSLELRRTDSDEQAASYEAQAEHNTEYIQKNPEWEFAVIYADDGISCTITENREEFNRMIEECEAGNIDMIITKFISRESIRKSL